MGELRNILKDLYANTKGLGENALMLGTSAIAEPVAGYAAMFDPVNGAQAIREGMTYQPRTEAGRMYQQGAAQAVGKVVKPVMPVVDTWQRGVDIAGRYSPTLGALMQTAPTALGVALGAKPTLQAGRQASNTLGAMQARMIANANAPRTLNTGFMGQRGSVGTQRPLTEFEKAHLIAQQNAALPVSQGGLGLAPDNTAMDRARAMGFDVDVYHGTGKDIGQFDLKIAADKEGRSRGLGLGRGKIYTSNEDVASSYAMAAPIRKLGKESNVLPLKTSGKFLPEEDYYEMFEQLAGKPSYSSDLDMKTRDAIIKKLDDKLKKEGYAGIMKLHYNEDGSIAEVGQTAIFDPKNIRSRFAAFDPMKKESSNLLAQFGALAPTATMAAYLYNQERNKGGKQ